MLSSIKCIIIYPNATMKDCNKFDTGMAEPKLENLWSNPFVFSSTIKYLKYKKKFKNPNIDGCVSEVMQIHNDRL